MSWVRRPTGSATMLTSQLEIDPTGYVFAAAQVYDGSLQLGDFAMQVPPNRYQLFLARLGTRTGSIVWARTHGVDTRWIDLHGMALTPDNRRVLLAGIWGGVLDLGDDGGPLTSPPDPDFPGSYEYGTFVTRLVR
jgi:hypothetical protein